MKMPIAKSQRGFSLLELMIASVIGLIVIMAMTQPVPHGDERYLTVTQRAETQQNMRAAIELMTKDISMAGAGLPSGGLQLPTARHSKVACNQTGTCYVSADTYPNGNYMYRHPARLRQWRREQRGHHQRPCSRERQHYLDLLRLQFPADQLSTFTFPSTTGAGLTVVNPAVTPNNILAPGWPQRR